MNDASDSVSQRKKIILKKKDKLTNNNNNNTTTNDNTNIPFKLYNIDEPIPFEEVDKIVRQHNPNFWLESIQILKDFEQELLSNGITMEDFHNYHKSLKK